MHSISEYRDTVYNSEYRMPNNGNINKDINEKYNPDDIDTKWA